MIKLPQGGLIGLVGIVGGLVIVTGQPAVAAGATVVRSEISAGAFVPCALGGAGEDVLVEGTVHTVVRTSTDGSGGTHVLVRANYDSLSGTGLTSGTSYRAVATEGSTSHNFEPFVGAPYNITGTRHVRFIGRGSASDFTVIDRFHVTVNARDEITVQHQDIRITCD
ncbi:MAG: hypothetical protein H0X59_08635 [Chloroflexi bacterium]|nr:hypothetical protein [Chloroflexota bacterium]